MPARVSNQARRAASIDAVTSAALKLFVAQGFRHTSMAQVAQEAELTKGAIYFYFSDKAELLESLLEVANRKTFLPILDELDEHNGNAKEKIEMFVTAVARLGVTAREQLLLPVLMAVEFAGTDDPIEARIRDMYARLAGTLESIVREGQKTGLFNEDLAPDTTAVTLVGLVDGLLLQWHRLHGVIDGAKLARTAREMVLGALTP